MFANNENSFLKVGAGSRLELSISYVVKPNFRPKVFNIAYTVIGINPSPEGAFLTLKGREFAEGITNKFIKNFLEYQSPLTVYTRLKIKIRTKTEVGTFTQTFQPPLRGLSTVTDGLRGTYFCRIKREVSPILLFQLKDFLISKEKAESSDFFFDKFVGSESGTMDFLIKSDKMEYTMKLQFIGKKMTSKASSVLFFLETFEQEKNE